MAIDLGTPAVASVRGFLEGAQAQAWLVGGAVRDILLGREPLDVDIATSSDPEPLARRFADTVGGSFFVMSEKFLTCRAVSPDGLTTWDFTPLRGADIKEDLGQRDFTVDAIAADLRSGALTDPYGGRANLDAGQLEAVSAGIFEDDPLRLLRAPRLEKTTGLSISPALAGLIRDHVALAVRPAPERSFAELARLLESPGCAAAARRLDGLGLLGVLLPELEQLKGITQNEYHHLDVYNHSLAVAGNMDTLVIDPGAYFPSHAAELKQRLSRRLAGDASWALLVGLAALLHDVGKPGCRFIDEDGQVRFFKHDARGADLVRSMLSRFHASAGLTRSVALLVAQHMRLEGVIQQDPPTERARRRYIRATEPFTPEAIMLSVCDRLAVRGPLVKPEAIPRHLALAAEMMDLYFEVAGARPQPRLLRGDDLIGELGLEPGPLIGEILERVLEEQELGHISSRAEALDLAGQLLEEKR